MDKQTSGDKVAWDSIETFRQQLSSYSGWGNDFGGETLKLIFASSSPVGKAIFEFQVKHSHTNGLGNLHGGCTATLFDWTTTLALCPMSKPGFWEFKGVSRTLNVTYLRPVSEGEVVVIENEVVHIGRKLCTLKGVMRRKSDGSILSICEHGKVNIDREISSKI